MKRYFMLHAHELEVPLTLNCQINRSWPTVSMSSQTKSQQNFCGNWRLILKLVWKHNGFIVIKVIFKKNKVEEFTEPDFKFLKNATVVKKRMYWCEDRWINKRNWIKNWEIYVDICDQLISNKDTKIIQQRK